MIPNGAAYDNFPPFANSGIRSAPAEAKYAQGMVPADTFPAEWANYFFHGSTAGITRLNADTGSIKKEINNVLADRGITPDATSDTQLLQAIDKIFTVEVTANYAPDTVRNGQRFFINANQAITITLPAGDIGDVIYFINSSQFTATIDGNKLLAGETLSLIYNGASGWLSVLTKSAAIDVVYPVNKGIYVQYPQQESPQELWPWTTWTVINYDGAFFRAQGTNANAFIEKTDSLVKQSDQNQSHYHRFTPRGSVSVQTNPSFTGTEGTVSVSGGNHRHQLESVGTPSNDGNGGGGGWRFDNIGAAYTYNSGSLSMSGNFTPRGSISGGSYTFTGTENQATDSRGGNEARPVNYTIRVWKRIA